MYIIIITHICTRKSKRFYLIKRDQDVKNAVNEVKCHNIESFDYEMIVVPIFISSCCILYTNKTLSYH